MLLDENDHDFLGLGHEANESIAPPFATTASHNHVSYVDLVRDHKHRDSIQGTKPETTGLLDSEEWHRPYAEALMETDPAKLVPLIAIAERAIFGRYLELCITRAAIEHSIDLQNAVYYLSQLKKANANVCTFPKS
jgi:hypothetical protein